MMRSRQMEVGGRDVHDHDHDHLYEYDLNLDHLHDHHMMRAVKTDGSGWEDSGRREMGAQMQ